MRLLHPRPGNPWPHDMVIGVDPAPSNICMLLYIRSAWGIAADADVPPLVPVPERGTSAAPDTASLQEWGARWAVAWRRAWDWYEIQEPRSGQLPTQEMLRSLAAPGQPLHPLVPPFWYAEHGDKGLDWDAYGTWQNSLQPIPPPLRVQQSPEHLSLPALIEAWQGGLGSIITLPYQGWYARRITRRHLVVSTEVRANPGLYARALLGAPAGG
ncbi:hypothetical protein [Arthrobacter sp. 35W]|uniref:hypothetical protein n=1 Tax=Arthrobacter sp. 35W TaxID=1132441 RepID=UPI0003FA449F|nr:hypothetical protein [Arthrobacter sp. 35W]